MCEHCNCSDPKNQHSSVLQPRQGRPYVHIDGSVRYQPIEDKAEISQREALVNIEHGQHSKEKI